MYARFSSDDWKSDVYAYLSAANNRYVTHVAACRLVGDIPPLVGIDDPDFAESYLRQAEAVKQAERVPIGLSCDGQTFEDDTLAGLLVRLEGLRETGYYVPESALQEIRGEKEEKKDA
ncbi:MAG: hypothetical protein Q7O66_16555 [Dehalococcoidia bacterium]|nr:hypothetical protein [Dehalococcoidia bacterium]